VEIITSTGMWLAAFFFLFYLLAHHQEKRVPAMLDFQKDKRELTKHFLLFKELRILIFLKSRQQSNTHPLARGISSACYGNDAQATKFPNAKPIVDERQQRKRKELNF